jgi:hypothetical protein
LSTLSRAPTPSKSSWESNDVGQDSAKAVGSLFAFESLPWFSSLLSSWCVRWSLTRGVPNNCEFWNISLKHPH